MTSKTLSAVLGVVLVGWSHGGAEALRAAAGAADLAAATVGLCAAGLIVRRGIHSCKHFTNIIKNVSTSLCNKSYCQ